MQTREWRTIDKSDWGNGPWQDEPDKKQWQDASTGLPCLVVRGPHGALCGYVGVPQAHPLHGVGYSTCRHGDACPDRKPDEEWHWCDHRPESLVDVHGGLTFSDHCADVDREWWQKSRERFAKAEQEAARHPRGDAARLRARLAPVIDDFEAWAEHTRGRAICHIPDAGEPDHVWWFGFDCAHCGDLSPGYGARAFGLPRDGIYRDLAYVERQCANLARQLVQPHDAPRSGDEAGASDA